MKIPELTGRIYRAFQDDISRNTYARLLLYNMTKDSKYLVELVRESLLGKTLLSRMEEHYSQKKILFGAGIWGRQIRMCFPDVAWECYVDNYVEPGTEISGLRAIPFQEMVEKYSDAYVVVSTYRFWREVRDQLLSAGFREENIFLPGKIVDWAQYFDIPALRPKSGGDVFVSAGPCEGITTLRFVEWSRGIYRRIYLFEPNVEIHEKLERNLDKVRDYRLIGKGLWDCEANLEFHANPSHPASSFFIEHEVSHSSQHPTNGVPVVALDHVLGDEDVSFIKMDIEGAEYRALMGAEQIIRNRRPKLAICIYHKIEDLWDIPALLLEFQPDYKFYVRHYDFYHCETVLYAL